MTKSYVYKTHPRVYILVTCLHCNKERYFIIMMEYQKIKSDIYKGNQLE